MFRPDELEVATEFAIDARGVRKRFGTVEALRGLDLAIRAGEIYGLLGPNGSGKTTFIRCVAGLLRPEGGTLTVLGGAPSVPEGGTLTVLGGAPSAAASAGRVGYMTQAAALYG